MLTFTIYQDRAGEYRWYLMAANNWKPADSGEGYRNRSECDQAIDLVKRSAATAPVQSSAGR